MSKALIHSCVLGCLMVLTWMVVQQQDTIQTEIYPESFGAKGDSAADDTAALQAAINAASIARGAGTEIVLSRRYRITAPLEIINDAAHNFRRGLIIKGFNGAPAGQSVQTGLVWAGPSDQPIIKLHSRENVLQHFAIVVEKGYQASAAIEIDQAPGTVTNTRNTFEYLRIEGGVTGAPGVSALTNGVVIGPRPGIYNLDFNYFRQVFINQVQEACIAIQSNTGQSKHNTFESCVFIRAKYGIKQTTGSFEAYGCAFSSLSVAAISLYAPTDNIYVVNPDSEGCTRFIESRGGGSAGWPLMIQGGRFEMENLADDGRYIDYHNSGPLTIQGAQFSNVPKPQFRIHADAGGPGGQLIVMGCQFPNTTPFEVSNTRLNAFGNRGLDESGNAALIADQRFIQAP